MGDVGGLVGLGPLLQSTHFELRGRLGTGGMGVVYEAFDRERGARVALKTLNAWSPERLYLFKREFRALADLHHENLVRIYELFADGDSWFFTMELLEGTDFLSWVGALPSAEERPTGSTQPAPAAPTSAAAPPPLALQLDEARLRDGLRQLASGLVALHSAGKVHRDLKPSNVWVTPLGRVVILDFGLVADTAAPADLKGARFGSPSYCAPEVAAGGASEPASDWYSVGVMLYRAMTGGFPPETGAQPQRGPRELARLCSELLRLDPAARPTGEQVLRRLGVERPTPHPVDSFQGREAELGLLRRAFEQSRAGEPVVVLVEGESGIGKSALCRQFVQGLAGARAFTGRCYERAQVPFNALDGVMDALTRHLLEHRVELPPSDLALLRTAFPVLGRVAGPRDEAARPGPAADPDRLIHAIAGALRSLLARLAADLPLVLWVDDLQWADGDSVALLRDLLRGTEATPLLFVCTQRSQPAGPAGPPPSLEARLDRAVTHLELGSLTPEESDRLVSAMRSGLSAHAKERIVTEGAGHPLYLQELVWGAAEAQRPLRLDEALRLRVQALPPTARTLVELVAVAGTPLEQATLASAAGLERAEARRWSEELRGKGLVQWRGVRPSEAVDSFHDRVREAVLAGLEAKVLRQRHDALAQALEAEGAAEQAPERLVLHLKGSGRLERAAEVAVRAAERARAALAFERAAELYKVALEASEQKKRAKQELRLAYAECSGLAGRGVDAAEAYLAAKHRATPEARIEYQRLAAENLLGSGHLERGLLEMRRVLSEIGEGWPETRPGLWGALAIGRAKLSLRGRKLGARRSSPSDLLRLRAYWAVSVGLMTWDPFRAALFHSRFLALALDGGDESEVARGLAIEAVLTAALGDRDSPRIISEAMRLARLSTDPELMAVVSAFEGMMLVLTGHLRAGAGVLTSGITFLGRHQTNRWLLNRNVFALLHTLDRLGALKELAPIFDDTLASALRRGDRSTEMYIGLSCSSLWLARDDVRALRTILARPAWEPPEGGYSAERWLALHARAVVALYEGTVTENSRWLTHEFRTAGRSFVSKLSLPKIDGLSVEARVAVALAERGQRPALATAIARARVLERVGQRDARVLLTILEACVSACQLDRARAIARLRIAEEAARSEQMWLHHHVANRRLGELTGGARGAAMVAEADAWMREEGIKRPDRMSEVIAPGFSGLSCATV